MAQNDKTRFEFLRNMVMNAIGKQLEEDGCCKSYEGAFEWIACYPNYFENPDPKAEPNYYALELHCYVLGPGRHYRWSGKTKTEVLDKAEREISSWLRQR